jgi:hypothetical protein
MEDCRPDYFTDSVKSTFNTSASPVTWISRTWKLRSSCEMGSGSLSLEHLPGVVQHPVLEFVTQTVGQSRSYHPDIDAIFININALDPHILEAERP